MLVQCGLGSDVVMLTAARRFVYVWCSNSIGKSSSAKPEISSNMLIHVFDEEHRDSYQGSM